MNVLLLQLDGRLPNLALMRLSAHHKALGDHVELRRPMNPRHARAAGTAIAGVGQRTFDEPARWDKVYASAIFTRSLPIVEEVRRLFPEVELGGTGVDETRTLADVGVTTSASDYTIYPHFTPSMGFTQRGCRLKCSFCVVPRKEGNVVEEQTIAQLWRGEPWPKHLILLDNDFFGQPNWRARIDEIREGGYKVSFNQGINARMLDDTTAEAIASVQYRDDSFKSKRIYTAWDNKKDEARLFRGLDALVRHGVRPSEIMVYILIAYWPGETEDDWEFRRLRLRAFGAVPYPMPFRRTRETIGYQRWVTGAHDKHSTWAQFKSVGYQSKAFGDVFPVDQPPLPTFPEPSWQPKQQKEANAC